MGRAFVLLLIGVMEAALHRLQSENIPKAITGWETTDALSTAFPTETSYPVSEWVVSIWIFVDQNSATLILLSWRATVRWTDTTITFYDGTSYHDQTTSEGMMGKWVFYQLGSTTALSYACVTIRNANPYYIPSSKTIQVQSTDAFNFFSRCGGLTVITI